ncbi:MAG: 50S ribosomal protein L6 [Candidatus Obscuribacterales bacterium]|nr:50S ribosomal protein L6 [Candidatus Obscuribacterales bacterium]
MSRIGKAPIPIPAGVIVTINGDEVKVKGPKGELKRTIRPELEVVQEDGKIVLKRKSDDRQVASLHGLSRTLIANMVQGVTQGFTKNMDIIGVGYRAAVEGKTLVMQLGYSHPVEIPIPDGLTVTVTKNVAMTITSPDRQQLGDFCAFVRDRRPPEVYKGKGVKYSTEKIRRKAGKAAGKKK